MRNSRRVNATLIIAIVGSCLPATFLLTTSTSALGAIPQELNGPILNRQQDSNPFKDSDVEGTNEALDESFIDNSDPFKPRVPFKKIDNNPPAQDSLPNEQKDKWALDDDDRMTDEEMNKELFGDDDPKSENEFNPSKPSSQGDESDSDPYDKGEAGGERDADRKKLAPRQTIEGYLKNINSLTVDTRTEPSTSGEGIDVPMKMMPPMIATGHRSYPVTGIRYQTPDIYHNPLYFEDRAAERGGVHQCRRQPIVSAQKFAGDVFELPKNIRNAHPKSCEYHQNLRYAQPGLIRN